MPSTEKVFANNRLLAALPQQDREKLLSHCQQVELTFAEELYRAGELILHVYFPTEGFIALMMPGNDNAEVEVGLVGDEGILGSTLILGNHIAPFHAVVQGTGSALCITAEAFLHELEQSPALQLELKHYLSVSITQLGQTAACNRFHLVEARLARWLLMTQDRAHSNQFHLTHVFLAYILGVRRVGVTKAASSLLKQKLISYKRGDITILDRMGLEAISCECYQADKEIYQRILG